MPRAIRTARSAGSFFCSVRMWRNGRPSDPLHDHVETAAIFVAVYPGHAGMIELLANLIFALETIEK